MNATGASAGGCRENLMPLALIGHSSARILLMVEGALLMPLALIGHSSARILLDRSLLMLAHDSKPMTV